jgi:hypothetical protein
MASGTHQLGAFEADADAIEIAAKNIRTSRLSG